MDQLAVERGVLTSYDLLFNPNASDTAWNVAVLVGYPSAGGYADIAPQFEAIRAAHTVVPVGGKSELSQLGQFVSGSELLIQCP